MKSEYIVPCLVDYEETALLKALDLVNQLLGIYAATQGQLKTMQHERPGSIAGCLRTFLNNCL